MDGQPIRQVSAVMIFAFFFFFFVFDIKNRE